MGADAHPYDELRSGERARNWDVGVAKKMPAITSRSNTRPTPIFWTG
jgi:hypothetical protein